MMAITKNKEDEMEIKVLGTGCAKCKKLFDLAGQAIAEAGVEATLTKVEQLDQILAYGIPFTPGLVVNGKVVSAGKLPKVSKIVEWIKEAT